MKFSKRLIVVILVIILCVPCICAISGPKSDVHAYSKMYSDQDVYYFSDSNPYIQEEEFEKNKLSVYYDVKNLLTPYEFRYLVYTGYFWGLNDKIVVIDIKTMLPDVRLLRDLFCLLKDQGCLVAFITPNLREDYEVELEGDEIDYLPVDYYESCQNLYWGAYRLFWDYTVFHIAIH